MATSLHEPTAAEVGRTLHEARLARGEELAAAAEELRVRPAYLEALEEGRLDKLLAPVYVVGHTRAYAKHLGLDGTELARRLKGQAGRGGTAGAECRKLATRRWRVAASLASLLLLGATAYAGYRVSFRVEPWTTPAPFPAAAAPASAPVTVAADPSSPSAPPDGPREAALGPTSPATAATQATELQAAQVAGPPLPAAESAPAAGPPAPEAATSPVPARAAEATVIPAPVQTADAPPPPAALTARDDAVATSGAPLTANIDGPAPPVPPSLAADTAGGPDDAAGAASAAMPPMAPGAPGPAAARAEAPIPSPAPGRFAIQVASLRDRAGVAGEWRRLVRLHPSLAGLELQPARTANLPGKGRFYRVLGGVFATRAEAQAACARLLAEGTGYCRPVPL